jgi:hypothetical protein
MGICFSLSTKEVEIDNDTSVRCFICRQPISHVNYIHCLSCDKVMHLRCFKINTDSMLECHMCGSENLKVVRLKRRVTY